MTFFYPIPTREAVEATLRFVDLLGQDKGKRWIIKLKKHYIGFICELRIDGDVFEVCRDLNVCLLIESLVNWYYIFSLDGTRSKKIVFLKEFNDCDSVCFEELGRIKYLVKSIVKLGYETNVSNWKEIYQHVDEYYIKDASLHFLDVNPENNIFKLKMKIEELEKKLKEVFNA